MVYIESGCYFYKVIIATQCWWIMVKNVVLVWTEPSPRIQEGNRRRQLRHTFIVIEEMCDNDWHCSMLLADCWVKYGGTLCFWKQYLVAVSTNVQFHVVFGPFWSSIDVKCQEDG